MRFLNPRVTALDQRDPEVLCWPSVFLEALGAKAKKPHIFENIIVFVWYPRPPTNHWAKKQLRDPFDSALYSHRIHSLARVPHALAPGAPPESTRVPGLPGLGSRVYRDPSATGPLKSTRDPSGRSGCSVLTWAVHRGCGTFSTGSPIAEQTAQTL